MSDKELRSLKSDLRVTQFPGTSARGQRATTRDKSRNREEESKPDRINKENLRLSADKSKGENTVNKLNFSERESYTVQSKATEDEIKELDKVTLVAFMLDLHNSPGNKKDYEKQFNKDCAHLMEEVEREMTTSISTFNNIFDDNTNLNTNPTNNGAISLVEKAKNSAVRTKQIRNVDFPKIIYDLNKAANKFEEA